MDSSTNAQSNALMEVFTGKLPEIKGINSSVFNANRLKALSSTRALVAIRNKLYTLSIEFPANPIIEKGRQGPFISRPITLNSVSLNKSQPVLSMKHDIQDINIISKSDTNNADKWLVSCIDSHGMISTTDLNLRSPASTNNGERDADALGDPPSKKRK